MVRTGDWIKEGWELVKQDLGMQIVIGLVIILISGTGLGGLIAPALTCGWFYVLLQKRRNPSFAVSIGDVFSKGFEVFVPSLVAGILISIFTSIGSIACGVGSIVVGGMLILALPLIVDRKMEFWPAIMLSFETTKQNWLGWSLFVLVLGLIYMVAIILCVLPALVAYPLMMGAVAVAYDDTFKAEAAPAAVTPS